VEIYDIPMKSETVCGCIKIKTLKQFNEATSYSGGYEEYVRITFHACSHPPLIWATIAALPVYMQVNDTEKIRASALSLEELRDRSSTRGSLTRCPYMGEQVDTTYDMLKNRYPQFWTSTDATRALTLAEVDSLPSLGRTGPLLSGKSRAVSVARPIGMSF
jgi:hypothetical protein